MLSVYAKLHIKIEKDVKISDLYSSSTTISFFCAANILLVKIIGYFAKRLSNPCKLTFLVIINLLGINIKLQGIHTPLVYHCINNSKLTDVYR